MGKKYGYGSRTTSEEILKGKDLTGKHYVVTGTTVGGMGFYTALALFNVNAEVTLLSRNVEKMKATKSEIEKQASKDCKGKINMFKCDLAEQASVRNCVKEFTEFLGDRKIDCLINNAGLVVPKRYETKDGWEQTIAICHFGHFTLTLGLLPYIKEPGRIVMLSSHGHFYGNLKFDDLMFKKRKYQDQMCYGQAKLANVMFANELNRRLKESGKKITVNSVNPGAVKTNFTANVKGPQRILLFFMMPFFRNLSMGSNTSIFCAVDERIEGKGGLYFSACEDMKPNKQALDEEKCKKLFDVSEEMCNIKYPF